MTLAKSLQITLTRRCDHVKGEKGAKIKEIRVCTCHWMIDDLCKEELKKGMYWDIT